MSAPPDLSAGACYGLDDDTFFPAPGDQAAIARAIAICWRCPVRQACGDWADTSEVGRWGVWGGTYRGTFKSNKMTKVA